MRRLAICMAVAGSFGMACLEDTARSGELKVVHSIELRGPLIFGCDVTWDGELLWVAGSFQQYTTLDDESPNDPNPGSSRTYTFATGYSPSDGSVGSSLDHPYGMFGPHGFVWDGDHFWSTSTMAVWGLPVDTVPDNIYKFSNDGTLVDIGEAPLSPDAWSSALAWDGTHLWLSDRKHDTIMQVDPADMSVISSFDAPGPEPRGLTWDGSSLWSVDGSDDLIYQIDPSGNVLQTWTAPVTDPWGITCDGQHLWVLDNDSRRIYQLAVPEPSACVLLSVAAASLLIASASRKGGAR